MTKEKWFLSLGSHTRGLEIPFRACFTTGIWCLSYVTLEVLCFFFLLYNLKINMQTSTKFGFERDGIISLSCQCSFCLLKGLGTSVQFNSTAIVPGGSSQEFPRWKGKTSFHLFLHHPALLKGLLGV